MKKEIQELKNYISKEYDGDIPNALESIGGLKLVRKILGLKDFAILDSKLYELSNNKKFLLTKTKECEIL